MGKGEPLAPLRSRHIALWGRAAGCGLSSCVRVHGPAGWPVPCSSARPCSRSVDDGREARASHASAVPCRPVWHPIARHLLSRPLHTRWLHEKRAEPPDLFHRDAAKHTDGQLRGTELSLNVTHGSSKLDGGGCAHAPRAGARGVRDESHSGGRTCWRRTPAPLLLSARNLTDKDA